MLETQTNSSHGKRQMNETLASSEDAMRYSKASLSVDAAFAAEGISNAPAGLVSMVSDYVNRSTRDIPASKLAGMAPGSGNLGTAASAGVTIALGSLTPDQRAVMRAGGNPLSPADMASVGAKLGLGTYASQMKTEGFGGGSTRATSAAYDRSLSSTDTTKNIDALLKEGFTKQQIADVLPYAKQLGWNDRGGLRDLAGAGKEFAGLAAQLDDARKRGDTAAEARIRAQMDEQRETAKGKKRKHMDNIMDRLQGPSAEIKPNVSTATMAKANAEGQVVAAVAKQQDDTASELDAFSGVAPKPSVTQPDNQAPVRKTAEVAATPSNQTGKANKPERPNQVAQAPTRQPAPKMGG